ncbi:microsomal glutathione S-transferase 2 [Pempheris klunzingeri]|uniref:microsomal glutathione S-transferase 2 n=1 Tax=Pempheris klunzingeri TaxID=3127111 RepID=UPI0039803046
METDSPFLLAAVSLLSALQMGYLARRVGLSRITHKVLPPSVTGPPEFERTFRAHQNCVECYPVFLVTLWTCGLFFSEVTAAAGGLLYIIARQIYVNGYVKSTKKRLLGFYLTLAVFVTLSLLGLSGILHGILHKYFHIHL